MRSSSMLVAASPSAGQCVPECCHLRRGADRDPQPAVRTGLADQHAVVEQALPDGVPVGVAAEQHEVGVALGDLRPRAAQPGGRGVALGAQVVDAGEQLVGVPQRGQRGGLGDGAEVVGQPHHADRVADLRRGREVAEPGPGERERLAHRAGDDQVAQAGSSSSALGVPARRNSAYASSTTTSPVSRAASQQRLDDVERQRRAGRVVGRGQQHHGRPLLVDQLAGARRGRARSRSRGARRPSGCWCRGRTRDTSSTSARS